jgi:hypothetical protein
MKKIFAKIICLALIIVSGFLIAACEQRQNDDGQRSTQKKYRDMLPIHDGATDVVYKSYENEIYGSVSYKIKEYYPAETLINFYKEFMIRNGFNLFNPQDKRSIHGEWSYYSDATKKDFPYVAQLNLFWLNKNDGSIGILILKYFYKNEDKVLYLNSNSNLLVSFQIKRSN